METSSYVYVENIAVIISLYSGIEEEEDMGHQFLNRVVLAVCPDSSFAMFIPSPL